MPDLDIQYADYASWHRGLITGQADDDLAYWRQALDGATPACPAPDHSAPDHTDFSGDQAGVTVPASALEWLAATRTAAGTDFVALFAIWCLFLARHTGQRDLTVGTLVSGRNHPDTAGLIGFLVNTLALRVRVDPDADFPGYLRDVRAAVLDAFAHQEIPFDHVVRAVAPRRTAARNPLFTTMFSYVTETAADINTRDLPGGLTLTPLPAGGGGSHFDLSLTAARTPDGLVLRLEYSTDLYDPATIDRYLDSLTGLIDAVSSDPASRLPALLEPMPREQRLLASWNDAAAAPASAVPLHDLIAVQAAATPDVIAIEAQDTCLTYRELDAAATALARRLRRAGVRDGDIAGIHLRPGATAVTAILAAWKAGAAFLPLDPDLPPARIAAMVSDAGPVLLVTDAPSPCPGLDFLLTALPGQDEDPGGELPAVRPDQLAYLMYTSGSTGQPKAVMIQHRGVSNHATAQVLPRTGAERMRVAAGTSAFIADFFISQLATLAGGHTLVVLTREQRQDPRYLVALAADADRAVTALDCTTSQLQLLAEAGLLDAPHPPRVATFGGEACPPDLWTALRSYPALTANNAYGPAETAVDATILNVAESLAPLIGLPYGNARILLLDDEQRPVPPGTAGELCIAGPGVGLGYLGRPAQTAAVFIPDPGGPPGSRLYRSGDLARFTSAGLLEYLGRNDYQIKILGQRVEPEEVEAALRGYPGIAAAAVTAQGGAAGFQLIAHLIAEPGGTAPDPGAIRAWLADQLPAAAVPAAFRFTGSFPFTTGGKLDRKALAAAAAELGAARPPAAPPSTPAEYQIAAIWAGLLGHETAGLGVHDDFFALGGHSLLAARLALRLSAEFGTDIPLHQIFTHPTIAGQATWIDEHAGAPAVPIPRLAREGRAGGSDLAEVAASYAQERLWFLWQLAPDSATYHVSWCYEAGGLDVERLAAAVDAMVARHEILRTTLHDHDGQIVQRIRPAWNCGLTSVPVAGEQAAAAADAAASEVFDLSKGPLLRVRAWNTGPGAHLLLFTAHHVIIDEWSLEIFERELWELYATSGDAAGLAEPAIQYADYAAWHRELTTTTAGDDVAWWTRALDGAAPASPPADHPEPDRTSFSGDQAVATAGPGTIGWLTATRTAAATTDFVVLLAVWSLFLARHAGRRDLTIGTPVSGRSHPDTSGLIGFLVNTLALRIRIDPAADFPAHVAHVREVVLGAFAHQEIPFDHVVRAVAPQRNATRNPLFTTSYAHDPATSYPTRDLPGGLALTPVAGGDSGSHFDLSLTTARTSAGLALHLGYSTDLYDRSTITGYLDSLTELLAALVTRPAAPLHAFLEPSARETAKLRSWNDQVTAPTSVTPLHGLIAAQAAVTPDAVAVEAPDMTLTYRQLESAATALARRLIRAGTRPGDVVAVNLPPTATAVTAVLAIWKAGAAFLPLDPDLPPARVAAMTADARPVLILTTAPTACPHLDLDPAAPGDQDHDADAGGDLPEVGPHHLAYLMYTSGTTGQPKAIMIQHGGVSNYATAHILPRLGTVPGPLRMATGTSAFITDFFIAQLAALAAGHALVVLSRQQRQDPRYLVALAADPARAVTALECTPSQLRLLIEAGLLQAPCPPRIAVFGGEPCPPDLWDTLRAHPAMTAMNTYGPTETTVDATGIDVADSPVPLIGRPYGNTRTHLLDDRQRPVPPGTAGELCIAGPGVGPGYLHRPAQTADAFIPDPAGPPGSRQYRTGDLARYTPGGALEFLGRNDHQIKIHGQRVEPEEVETVLRAHPGITAAAVTARRTPAGHQLTAHLIPAPGTTPDPDAIRAWLARRLPAAAIPATIRYTAALPLTTGGKLDRQALAAAADELDLASAPAVPPGTRAELAIAGVWAGLLGREPDGLSVHDDFFALGGHSLTAARLALRLSAELGTDIPLHEIFTHPTIAGQAAWADGHAGTPPAPPIPRLARDRTTDVAASYAQERLWFLWQLAPGSPTYHVPWAYETSGLDVERLSAAIDAMIERHEVLRTTLHDHDGQISQRIGPAWHCGLTGIPATGELAAKLAEAAASEVFDLSEGPLLRVHAWHTGPGAHLLLFAAHHVIIDEWSLEIFESELWQLYAAGGDHSAAAVPEPAIQYADYAAWHRELTAGRADDDLAWWTRALDGAEPASPVPDHAAPDRTDFSGDHAETTAGPAAAAWLDAARTTAATTDFVVLLALYSVFLARHAGRRDVTIGTLVSGRDHPDTAGLIGFLVNTLALRIRVDPALTFPGHIAYVKQVVLDAFAHQEIPFEHVVRAAAPQRTAARNPLFTTSFAHDVTTAAARAVPGGLTLTPRHAGGGGSHFDLSLATARTPEGLCLGLDYSTALYDPATITGYLASLSDLLTALTADPGSPVHRLLEPAPREAARLRDWNSAAAAPASALPLHDLITAQAAATPGAIAVEAADTTLTYRQLDTSATALARRLRRAGVRDGDIVGIHLPPAATAITAILAAWKAGAAFLPLDPDLPAARLAAMIDDARPALLITDTPTARPHLDLDLTTLDKRGHENAGAGDALPAVGPDHLAYLIYTSGTTGQPKAVMIAHRGLSNHASAQVLPRVALAGERMRVATGTSAFIADFFIAQLAALAGGHTLVVLNTEQRQDPRYLTGLAADPDRAVTALDCTTSQLQLLVEAGLLSAPHPPRLATFGGEACPPDLWTALRGYPALTAWNTYGPAEATVEATIAAVTGSASPLIGRPYGNAAVRLLDDRQRPVPPGTVGELCIAGPGVGYGYLRRPAQTAAAFIPDPDGPPGSRLYRTGDLARYTRDGALEYHGRTDHQIKILGQRVEPGEVEATLRACPEITAAAVTAHRAPGGHQLTAHLIPAPGSTPDTDEIRAWLAQRLPAAAIPAAFRFTGSFPFTTGGKLDRKALAAAAAELDAARPPAAPPGTPAEYQIAAIWAGLLGHDLSALGIHDDFFALGGHSLTAARLALRLSAEFGTDIPLHRIFAYPTIAGQATWIAENAGIPAAAPIPRLAPGGATEAAASYAQERMWFLWQLAPDSATYRVPWAYEATGLDVERLAAAVDAMIERHEILRTTLHDHDGQISQRIGPAWRCGLTSVPATPAQAAAAADATAAELFDLSAGPLLRVRAWATAPDTHLVLFTAHHVVIDEWSLEIFERELWELYAAGGDLGLAGLAEPAIQYASYAAWHRELTTTIAADDITWWTRTLDGAEPASPVPDHPAPDRADFSGDHAETTASQAAVAWLDAARTTAATTDYVVLLALYSVFLARHAGRRDLTIGTMVSGRDHPDTAELIGFLVNTLALRITVDTALTFPGHIAYVRQVVLDAFAHQEIPFEHVVRAVAPQRAAARNPLFTTSFAHNIASPGTLSLPGGLTLAPYSAGGTGGSHFDLSLSTTRSPDGLTLGLEYSTALYEPVTIAGYLESLTDLLATLTADPGTTIRALLEPTRREAALLGDWNDTATPTTATPVHDLIAAQAAVTPDAIAVEAPDTTLTYAQLDANAAALARHLTVHGTRPGDIIAIHLPPGATAITAILAAWKAGAAFLPLDPDLPAARVAAMIDDARPARILTTTPTTHPHLDLDLAALTDDPPEIALPAVSPHQLAYLMYTSGSTGQPKAVMIHHGGVSNYAAAQMLPRLRVLAGEEPLRMAAGTSAFISDFFMAQLVMLAGGHTLVVLTSEQRQDPRYLVSLAADPGRAITALECTTSQLQLYAEAGLFDAPHPPRLAMFGGEHCPPDLWETLRSYPALAAVNTYGPAETSVDATLHNLADSPVPLIGRAYGNTVIRVLDEDQRPVPPGVAGELCIAGPGVGYGYLGRPAQTAAVFIPDPAGPAGSRIYRTGDLARFTTGGQLEFRGRNDHQIKILGQRVEPEEIEAVLRTHPQVTAAAVTAHATPAGIQLTAHLIPAPGAAPGPDDLRAWLAQRLPAAAVPAAFSITASFPLTTGGKLDRKALTAAAADLDTGRAPSTPPGTPAEYQVAAIWAGLLGADAGGLGVHDDFFALGGHSLLAARLALRLSAELSADIPLHQVFTNPTIAGQAGWISENAGTAAAAPIPRPARDATYDAAASCAQERIWFLWQLAPGSPTYHVPWAYEATGLDVGRLAAAVDAMIERHEILRTTLHDHHGQIVQRIGPAWRCGLTAVPATSEQAAAAADAAADELFDLSAGPLLRVRAWATGPDTHLLLFTAHHVIIDEWSLEIFETELWELYAARGDAAALQPLAVQYADYAVWHRELTAGRTDEDLAWWTRTLDGAGPASPVPDHPAPDRTDFAGDHAEAAAGHAAMTWLDAARTTAATTDFVVLLALYSVFLARHAGRRDLTIGTPVSGRDHPDTAGLIGFLVNTLALRIRIDTALTFPGHIAYVKQVVLDAFAHQEIPFEHVVRAVAPQRTAAANPLFTASYAHNLAAPAAQHLPGGLTLAPHSAGGGSGSHFDLTLSTTRAPDGLYLGLEYSTALYERSTIDTYLASLTDLLTTLTARPDTPVGELLAPTPREAARLRDWNDTATPTTTTPLPDLIAAQASATPEATAVEAPDTTLTYRELDAAATALARHLTGRGVRPGDIIGVHLAPTAVAITAILAIWKAGAAFLPLDPDLPPARVATMIDDARPARILTTTPTTRPHLDLDLAALAGDPPETALPTVSHLQLAFLIYTSGSTGQPKAIMIHHAALSNYAAAQMLPRLREFAGDDPLRLPAGTSAFISDFFIAQLVTLAGGHALVVLTRDQRQDPRYLTGLAADPGRAITALECTTSQLQLYAEAGLLDAPYPPRIAMFAGEACPPDLWSKLRGYQATISVNAYGPAETMMDCTQINVADGLDPVIGRPYGNTIVRVLDDHQRPVPPGTTGELCIAGPGVGYGYLHRPAQTAAVFIPDPDGPPGSRQYRTGDLARYTRHGTIEFHGRNDHQIKILGQRVEPGEIEAVLRAHPQVAAAAVTAHRTPAGFQLTAHLVAASGMTPDPEAIRTWLSQQLPAAAVPASFRCAASFPMTLSGKLDRKALTAAAEAEAGTPRTPATPPGTPAERQIAAIWAGVLGQDAGSIGIHDDFFAIGGHSLLAARLALHLQAGLAAIIPLHQVFASPTIAGQAAFADRAGADQAASAVQLMGGQAGLPPLVLVHPLGGALAHYRELAAALSTRYHVLGIHADPLNVTQPATLGERAAGYARQLAPVLDGRQPVIAGWSAGGVIAQELAVQLLDSAITVSQLILIDTSPPDGDDTDAAGLDRLRPQVLEHGPGRLLAEEGADSFLAALGVDHAAFAELDAGTAATLTGFWQHMLTSLARHQPRRFDGPARLILSADQDEQSAQHAITTWQAHAGPLTVTRSDADHFQLLQGPWVSAVAEAISSSDDAADPGPTTGNQALGARP